MGKRRITQEMIGKLPKWAQAHIDTLLVEIGTQIRQKRTLENLVRCHDEGMAWTTVSNPVKDEPLRLFSLSPGGAMLQVTLYKGDCLFVGRAKS